MTEIEVLTDLKDYPVVRDNVKNALRVYNTDQDFYIEETLIPSVVNYLESQLNRSLTTKTVRVTSKNIKIPDLISLPYFPYTSIDTITSNGTDVKDAYLDLFDNGTLEITRYNYVRELTIEYTVKKFTDAGLDNAIYSLCSAWFNDRLNPQTPKNVVDYILQNTRKLWF